MRDFFCFHNERKMRPWRHIEIQKNYNIEIPRPKSHNIEIRWLKHLGIGKWRQLSRDIVIPRHFFREQNASTSRFQYWKTTTSRFQDQKSTTSSFCRTLTLMPADNFILSDKHTLKMGSGQTQNAETRNSRVRNNKSGMIKCEKTNLEQ